MCGTEEGLSTRDVLIASHGHFSRCLIARWINAPLHFGASLTVEPGSVRVNVIFPIFA